MASAAAAMAVKSFIPRTSFSVSENLTRTWYLGHHAAALERIRATLSMTGLVIECRDARVPFSSRNPVLESVLAAPDVSHIVVYTKADLATAPARRDTLRRADPAADEVVWAPGPRARATAVLAAARRVAEARHQITGLRAMVVGMPNVGKSSLLNALRAEGGVGRQPDGGVAKVSRVSGTPGTTRRLQSPVKIVPSYEDDGGQSEGAVEGGVYIVDTPGVFVPYVKDTETMLKLALTACVRDGVVPAVVLADYLLFALNRQSPKLYKKYSAPTNEVVKFLEGVAQRTGRLRKGGEADIEAAANWVVQQFRQGKLGKMCLDPVDGEALERYNLEAEPGEQPLSFTQAKKRAKEERKQRQLARRQGVEFSEAAL
jgi:mitochondrial GTPase 1